MTIGQPQNIILDGNLLGQLRAEIEDIFGVERVETPREAPQGTIIFWGDLLRQDSEAVYDLIAERWYSYQYTPILRQRGQRIALIAQPGIVIPQPTNPWINLGLAIVTLVSVMFTGAVYENQCIPLNLSGWLRGVPMMLALMAILMTHEFGHYFAARHHKVSVTLPYFIPLPLISPVGTLGAFIRLRSPFKTKKQLFDIGVAGPLGGLIFAIPLILWGVAVSPVRELNLVPTAQAEAFQLTICTTASPVQPPDSVVVASGLEGNSIFYLGTKYLIHGQLLPSFDNYDNLPFIQEFLLLLGGVLTPGRGVDIFIDSVVFAVWFGLLVTAMNLVPVGQLDGGHIIYCLLGEKARFLGIALVFIMLLAGIFWWPGWLVWAIITFLIVGPGHPPPLNDLVPLGLGRTILAYIMIFIFLILFMPNPLPSL